MITITINSSLFSPIKMEPTTLSQCLNYIDDVIAYGFDEEAINELENIHKYTFKFNTIKVEEIRKLINDIIEICYFHERMNIKLSYLSLRSLIMKWLHDNDVNNNNNNNN